MCALHSNALSPLMRCERPFICGVCCQQRLLQRAEFGAPLCTRSLVHSSIDYRKLQRAHFPALQLLGDDDSDSDGEKLEMPKSPEDLTDWAEETVCAFTICSLCIQYAFSVHSLSMWNIPKSASYHVLAADGKKLPKEGWPDGLRESKYEFRSRGNSAVSLSLQLKSKGRRKASAKRRRKTSSAGGGTSQRNTGKEKKEEGGEKRRSRKGKKDKKEKKEKKKKNKKGRGKKRAAKENHDDTAEK